MRTKLLYGVAAGSAGTTALNAATYLDMVLRARPASTTPETTIERIEELGQMSLSAEGSQSQAAANRRTGLGALTGIATGVGAGIAYAAVRPKLAAAPVAVGGLVAGLLANAGSVGPMTALKVTDPRTWSATSWLSDMVPHLCYGLVTAAVYEALWRGRAAGQASPSRSKR